MIIRYLIGFYIWLLLIPDLNDLAFPALRDITNK